MGTSKTCAWRSQRLWCWGRTHSERQWPPVIWVKVDRGIEYFNTFLNSYLYLSTRGCKPGPKQIVFWRVSRCPAENICDVLCDFSFWLVPLVSWFEIDSAWAMKAISYFLNSWKNQHPQQLYVLVDLVPEDGSLLKEVVQQSQIALQKALRLCTKAVLCPVQENLPGQYLTISTG